MRKLVLSGLAALAMIVPLAGPATAEPAVPDFDFADCPALPDGADPAGWRCEVMIADGVIDVGRLRGQSLGRMRLTFAEGRLDGEYAQVFGALRTTPQPLPHGAGTVRVSYGGYSDFHSNDERFGEIHLRLRLGGPALPRDCAVGAPDDPIRFLVQVEGPPQDLPGDPPVRKITVTEDVFAAPATSGCGRLGPVADRLLGLPSPSGANALTMTAYVAMRDYA
jgi:hypothetical protein